MHLNRPEVEIISADTISSRLRIQENLKGRGDALLSNGLGHTKCHGGATSIREVLKSIQSMLLHVLALRGFMRSSGVYKRLIDFIFSHKKLTLLFTYYLIYQKPSNLRVAPLLLPLYNMPGLTIPPFPDDVPTHPLLIIDYALIKSNNTAEIEKLWKAARQLGFW